MKRCFTSVHLLAVATFAWSSVATAENTITIRSSRDLGDTLGGPPGGTLGGPRETDVDLNSDFENIPSLTLQGTNGGKPMVYHKKTLGGAYHHTGGDTWYGEMDNVEDKTGVATMIQDKDGVVAASFTDNDGVYQMNTLSDGSVVMDVQSYDELEDDEGEEYQDELAEAKRKGQGLTLGGSRKLLSSVGRRLRGALHMNETEFSPLVNEDQVRKLGDGAEVHVLVIYTKIAMCAEDPNGCDKGPIERRIKLAETETNIAYQDSGMSTRIKVVHMHMDPDFNELGGNFPGMLDALGKSKDGLSYVRDMRKEVGADLVSMIANQGGYCGYGNIKGPYSVTKRTCSTGYYSFGHEIAHNFGCFHNRENSNRQTNYAHGYQDPDANFRSVLAYRCEDKPCPRVPRYSNPTFPYQGKPIGDSQNDCARQIDEYSPIVAEWMKDVSSTSCEDYPDWTDKDGEPYDCDWYAARDTRCERYGHLFPGVNGLTANKACCVCGREENQCKDLVQNWHDRDGPDYDCDWYALNDHCSEFGDGFADAEGRTANQVCCACDGGND